MSLQQTIKPLVSALEKMPQKTIAAVISGVLLVYIAYLFAQMTWLMVPNNSAPNQLQVSKTGQPSQNRDPSINVEGIKSLNLFGEFNAQPSAVKETVQDAPQTRLNLTLTGVVASNDTQFSSAIIESGGNQYTYGIGDKIEKTRATLEKVYNDRVLIKQSGTLETLMLDGVKYNKASTQSVRNNRPSQRSTARTKPVIDQRDNKSLAKQATVLKQNLTNNPAKITDYLRISPMRQGNELMGYRLGPGKKPEFFRTSGLKQGDIAIQMNGLDLTSPQEASQALKVLRSETEITLLVDRDGELTEILFSIN